MNNIKGCKLRKMKKYIGHKKKIGMLMKTTHKIVAVLVKLGHGIKKTIKK